jgi:fibronectin type 3 domain-containing protein
VRLTWMEPATPGSAPKYRVYRWVGEDRPMPIADTNAPEYLDASAQFGTQYHYMVMALENETRQSVVSQTETITPKDVFPPAVPAGVTASAANNAIELAWVRNTEADFRGYNVFRAEGNGPFEKIASSIDVPLYRDAQVEPGKTYRYEVSAVDLLNNESARSEPVTAALP